MPPIWEPVPDALPRRLTVEEHEHMVYCLAWAADGRCPGRPPFPLPPSGLRKLDPLLPCLLLKSALNCLRRNALIFSSQVVFCGRFWYGFASGSFGFKIGSCDTRVSAITGPGGGWGGGSQGGVSLRSSPTPSPRLHCHPYGTSPPQERRVPPEVGSVFPFQHLFLSHPTNGRSGGGLFAPR